MLTSQTMLNRATKRQKRNQSQQFSGAVSNEQDNLVILPSMIGQAALLEWLGQPPISFHRVYVDIAGGVLPALWLSCAMEKLAQAQREDFAENGDFLFSITEDEMELESGLTFRQQSSCRRQLVSKGLLSTESSQDKSQHRLRLNQLARKLIDQSESLARNLLQAQRRA